MDDAGARIPETNAVFSARGLQEVIDFLIDVLGALQILRTADLSLDQVIAVDGGGYCDFR